MSEKNKSSRAETMKSRTLSDADLLKEGGEYNEKGELQVPNKDDIFRENDKDSVISNETLDESSKTVLGKITRKLKELTGEEPEVSTTGDGILVFSKNNKRFIRIFPNWFMAGQLEVELRNTKYGSHALETLIINKQYKDASYKKQQLDLIISRLNES